MVTVAYFCEHVELVQDKMVKVNLAQYHVIKRVQTAFLFVYTFQHIFLEELS